MYQFSLRLKQICALRAHFCLFLRLRRQFPCAARAEITFVVKYHLCTMTWRSCVPIFIEIGAKMRATRAFLSIFAPSAPISARCARGNFFSHSRSCAQWSKELKFQVSSNSDNFSDQFLNLFFFNPHERDRSPCQVLLHTNGLHL